MIMETELPVCPQANSEVTSNNDGVVEEGALGSREKDPYTLV